MPLRLTRFLSLLAENGINAIGTYENDSPFDICIYCNHTEGNETAVLDAAGKLFPPPYLEDFGSFGHESFRHYRKNQIVRNSDPLIVPHGFFSGLEGTPYHPEPHQYRVFQDTNSSDPIRSMLAPLEEYINAKEEQIMAEQLNNTRYTLEFLRRNGQNVIGGYDVGSYAVLHLFYNHTLENGKATCDEIYNLLKSNGFPIDFLYSFAHYNWYLRDSRLVPIEDIPDGFFSGLEEVLTVYPEDPSTPRSQLDYLSEDEMNEDEPLELAEYNDDEDEMIVLPLFIDSARLLVEPFGNNLMSFWKLR